MSDTIKAAVIIGVCLMLGLWGAGWLSKSDVGRYQLFNRLGENAKTPAYGKFDTSTGKR